MSGKMIFRIHFTDTSEAAHAILIRLSRKGITKQEELFVETAINFVTLHSGRQPD
jgi:hypothetical protein